MLQNKFQNKKRNFIILKNKRTLFYLFFICHLFLNAQNKSFVFHQITIADNLSSQNLNYYIYKDSKGFIWISSSQGLNCYNGKEIKQYSRIKGDTTSLIGNASIISHFFEDDLDNIWFGMPGAIQIYNRNIDAFEKVSIQMEEGESQYNYYVMEMDRKNKNLWFFAMDSLIVLPYPDNQRTNHHTIGKYKQKFNLTLIKNDKNNQRYLFTPQNDLGLEIRYFKGFYENHFPDTILKNYSIETQTILHKNYFFTGTNEGLARYDILGTRDTLFRKFANQKIINISAVAIVDSISLLVGTQTNGLFYFNTKKNKFTSQVYQFDGLITKPFLQPIDKIYIDKDKTLWVSTPGRGIFFANLGVKRFSVFLQNKTGESVDNNFIRSITTDNSDRIWCLHRNGISIIDKSGKLLPKSQKFRGSNVSFAQSYPYYIYSDKEDIIWVCDETGLYYLNPKELSFNKATFDNTSPVFHPFFSIIKQIDNREIIASTQKGLFIWNKRKRKLEKLHGLESEEASFSWIEENLETNQILLRKAQKSFLIGHFEKNKFHLDTTISFNPFIQFLHKDTIEKKFWLATSEGLFWLDYEGKNYKLNQDSILPFKSVIGVLKEDNSNNLWLSTNKGIVRYNPKIGEWKTYTLSDGLQSQEFNFFASHKTRDGKMIFGGVNGINIFDPKEIKDDLTPVNPTITSILINDAEPKEKLKCSETGAQNVSLIEKLDFDMEENTLSFRFAALDYVNPNANQFKYRMIGIEKDWTPPKTENFARYPNLSPGDYTFEVDATNSDGIWSNNPAQLRITIHPPWYQTNLAYGSYALLTLFIFFSLYNFQLNQRLKEAETFRLKELDNLKTALYTNITHEFRTPLTVIMGMASQIAEKPREWQQQGLEMIQRSGQNLLNLVNQMLDLAKIEAGRMQPKYVQGNIINYLQYLVESFHSYAATKDINLVFYKEVEEIIMDYDPDKLKTVLANLLSNAVKFTPEKGKIIVHANLITRNKPSKKGESATTSFCQIKIRDNGIGIAAEKLPHVFDRFYQVEDEANYSGGTGVGLALTKELIELMDGQIQVNSQLHNGSEFVLLLPFRQTAPLVKDAAAITPPLSPYAAFSTIHRDLPLETATDDALPLVLIIEDNLDVITYLQACLMDRYRIMIALDGQAGINKALEYTPDLIISDVMMPEKDGFEVCATLKEDERSSHIPIIMLTARAHIEDKITGLSKGADAYLSKPFHQKELEIRLEQLLLQRKRLQHYFAQQTLSLSDSSAAKTIAAPIESAFLKKVEQVIKNNLMADLGLDQICQLLLMSRSQVYRKIKALTGQSTTIFIRHIRLKIAHQLLTTTDKTISEVAYEVGFKDPSFFSRSFSEVYGKSPSEIKAR